MGQLLRKKDAEWNGAALGVPRHAPLVAPNLPKISAFASLRAFRAFAGQATSLGWNDAHEFG